MTKKILFLDDEQSLLNGIERRLGLEFDLTTTLTGKSALIEMKNNGPFAVVVTDMQMPEMNGVQFIQNAREFAPDTTYIMLTGNQDQTTATRAVNEGKVFRFLNKPCEVEDLKRAIEVGLRQYQLVTGEKELLHKTFVGAVGLLTEVLEVSHPEIFSEVPHIEQVFDKLRVASQIEEHWEYKLAARLGLLGIALLPEEERKEFQSLQPSDQQANQLLSKAASVASRMIGKIPRLQTVAEIVKHQQSVDGSIQETTGTQHVMQLGATFLRIAIKWNLLTSHGFRGEDALTELRTELPNLSTTLADALLEFESEYEAKATVEVSVAELKEGMILAEDIVTDEGAILLRRGRLLSPTNIEKLRIGEAQNMVFRPIRVLESTCPAQPVMCG